MLVQPTHDELVHFVRESNAIENIHTGPGSILFDRHLRAAEMIARQTEQEYLTTLEIHQLLLGGIKEYAGKYRTDPVCVGRHDMPDPGWVPSLMFDYERMVRRTRLRVTPETLSYRDRRVLARGIHNHGLCIHPFLDGNGRTFRLMWNQLRLLFGLPWITIEAKRRSAYYRCIRAYEIYAFEPEFLHTYSTDRY